MFHVAITGTMPQSMSVNVSICEVQSLKAASILFIRCAHLLGVTHFNIVLYSGWISLIVSQKLVVLTLLQVFWIRFKKHFYAIIPKSFRIQILWSIILISNNCDWNSKIMPFIVKLVVGWHLLVAIHLIVKSVFLYRKLWLRAKFYVPISFYRWYALGANLRVI